MSGRSKEVGRMVIETGSEPVEGAYEALVRLIREGHFSGGQRLGAADVADAIGVSRTPVREALSRLAAEGIVEMVPNRGARLINLAEADIAEILEMRCLLEPYAAARAAAKDNAGLVADLESLILMMDGAYPQGGWSAVAQLNNRFHDLIVEAAGSRLLADLVARAGKEPLLTRLSHRSLVDMAKQSREHRVIVAAIAASDPAWAQSAMHSHLAGSRHYYV